MAHKKIKTAARLMILYIVLTAGSWMFINSYTNSYNRMTGEQIAPASLVLNGGTASLSVLEHSTEISLSGIAPESKFYCAAYFFSPDELRITAGLISLCKRL